MQGMMLYSTHTWDLVWALESASPTVSKNNFFVIKDFNIENTTNFIACCKDFVKFQIEILNIKDSLPPFKINNNYFWITFFRDIDSDSGGYGNILEMCYNESHDDDNYYKDTATKSDLKETICYNLFVNEDLSFEKFCKSCQNIFLKIFSKLSFILFQKNLS